MKGRGENKHRKPRDGIADPSRGKPKISKGGEICRWGEAKCLWKNSAVPHVSLDRTGGGKEKGGKEYTNQWKQSCGGNSKVVKKQKKSK